MNTAKYHHVTILGLILALAAFAASQPALADGNEASATGDAKARLIAPLALANEGGFLNFGELIKNSYTGNCDVILEPLFSQDGDGRGAITTCDPAKVTLFGGHSDDDFGLIGEGGETIQVSAPASVELSKDGVGSPTEQQKLTLKDFEFRVNKSTTPETVPNGGTFVLEPDGETDVDAGGTLEIQGNDETGSYSGSYTVTVAYQ